MPIKFRVVAGGLRSANLAPVDAGKGHRVHPHPFDVHECGEDTVAALASLQKLTQSPYEDFEGFLRASRAIVLPPVLRDRVAAFARREGAGALLVRGLPLPADLPPTPLVPFAHTPRGRIGTETLLGAIAPLLGEPFSYTQWDAGLLVHNKYPIRAHRDIQFGSNAVDFLMHTETPFRPVSPDFLALLCVRGDPTGVARTRVSSLESAIAAVSGEVRAVLRTPSFAFLTDQPVVMVQGRGLTTPHPVLDARDGTERPQYVEDLVGVDDEAEAALDALRVEVRRGAADVALTPGDLLLLDNRRVVHGRNAFEPSYDGNDRWLQRMLISTSLFRDGLPTNGRLVPDNRFENYPTDYQRALRPAGAPAS